MEKKGLGRGLDSVFDDNLLDLTGGLIGVKFFVT